MLAFLEQIKNNMSIVIETDQRFSGEDRRMVSWKAAGLVAAAIGSCLLARALRRGWPAGLAAFLALNTAALGAGKDYAVCFSDGKVDADQLIAACTPIAEDK